MVPQHGIEVEPSADAIDLHVLIPTSIFFFFKPIAGSLLTIETINDGGRLADFVAQNLPSLDTETRQQVLETVEDLELIM